MDLLDQSGHFCVILTQDGLLIFTFTHAEDMFEESAARLWWADLQPCVSLIYSGMKTVEDEFAPWFPHNWIVGGRVKNRSSHHLRGKDRRQWTKVNGTNFRSRSPRETRYFLVPMRDGFVCSAFASSRFQSVFFSFTVECRFYAMISNLCLS